MFGVSSEEYLSYAETNRKEWQAKGREVVASYVEKYGKKTMTTSNNAAVEQHYPAGLDVLMMSDSDDESGSSSVGSNDDDEFAIPQDGTAGMASVQE